MEAAGGGGGGRGAGDVEPAAIVGREGGVGRMDKGGERGKREGKIKEKGEILISGSHI
jgi:hypothetical protein